MMRFIYRLWLKFEDFLSYRFSVNTVQALLFIGTLSLGIAVFLFGFKSIVDSRNQQVSEVKRVSTAKRVSEYVGAVSEDTFADEIYVADDDVFKGLYVNPSKSQVERYMTYLAGMYNDKTVDKARSVIPWKDEVASSKVGVSDVDAYRSKVVVPVTVAKTYNSSFETYIGLFEVTVTTKGGDKYKTKSAVTLTFSSGSAVSYSIIERNVK